MSDIKVQFVYKGQVRTGTVEMDRLNRKGLITLKTDNGYRSFRCDEVTEVKYLP